MRINSEDVTADDLIRMLNLNQEPSRSGDSILDVTTGILLKHFTPEEIERIGKHAVYLGQHGFWMMCGSRCSKFNFPQIHVHHDMLCAVYHDYDAYLGSPEWKEKADWAKARAGYRCQLCNRGKSDGVVLHAHHRTYERLGNELPSDLTVLCRKHHEWYELSEKSGQYRHG